MTATPVKFLVSTPKKISYFSNNREEDLILFADIYDKNGRISRNALTHDGVGFYSTELLTFTTKVFRDIRFIDNLNNVLSRTRLIVEDILDIDIDAISNAIISKTGSYSPNIFDGIVGVGINESRITAEAELDGIILTSADSSIKVSSVNNEIEVEDLTNEVHIDV